MATKDIFANVRVDTRPIDYTGLFNIQKEVFNKASTNISDFLEKQDLKAATEAEIALKAAAYKGDTQGIQDIMQYASSNIRDNKNRSLLLNQGRIIFEGIAVNEINLDLDEATRTGDMGRFQRALTKAQDTQGWISPEKQFELAQKLQTAAPIVEDISLGKQALSAYTSGIEAGLKRNLPIYERVFNSNPQYAELFSLEQGTLLPKEVNEQQIFRQLGAENPALAQTPEGVAQLNKSAQTKANELRLKQSQLEKQFMQAASAEGVTPINMGTGEQNLRKVLLGKGRSSAKIAEVVGEYQKQVAMSNELSSDAKVYEQNKHAAIDQDAATKIQITKDKYTNLKKFSDADLKYVIDRGSFKEPDMWKYINDTLADEGYWFSSVDSKNRVKEEISKNILGKTFNGRKIEPLDVKMAIDYLKTTPWYDVGDSDVGVNLEQILPAVQEIMGRNNITLDRKEALRISEKEIDSYYKELQDIQSRAIEEKFRATREARVRIDGRPDISGTNKLLEALSKAVSTATAPDITSIPATPTTTPAEPTATSNTATTATAKPAVAETGKPITANKPAPKTTPPKTVVSDDDGTTVIERAMTPAERGIQALKDALSKEEAKKNPNTIAIDAMKKAIAGYSKSGKYNEGANISTEDMGKFNEFLTKKGKSNDKKAILKALAMAESSGEHASMSKTGARGLMQLTEDAIKDYNRVNGTKISVKDAKSDLNLNMEIGTWYFERMGEIYFPNNLEKQLASYVDGPEATKAAIEAATKALGKGATEAQIWEKAKKSLKQTPKYITNFYKFYRKE